jgi:hypothetical protein
VHVIIKAWLIESRTKLRCIQITINSELGLLRSIMTSALQSPCPSTLFSIPSRLRFWGVLL